LLLSASLSLATENKAGAAGETKAISGAKAKGESAKSAKAAAKPRLVDINSAGKKELTTLQGIDDAQAEKIIAGRPYLSKAHLVTRKVLPRGIYENIKAGIFAGQK